MFSNSLLGLLDVVCGAPADVNSAHRFVHGGALFCFCSDECLARFIVDPHQFVPRPARAVEPAAAAPALAAAVAQPANAARGQAQEPARHVAEPIRLPRGSHFVEPSSPPRRRAKAPTLGPIPVAPTQTGNLLASLFAWREKRFAVRTCADLLRLHEIVAALNPGLTGRALYRQIVAAHHGGDLAHADAVLESAEQSFAIWPVERALRFADVVHYLAASEFLAGADGARWIHADMKRIVAARIPHDL